MCLLQVFHLICGKFCLYHSGNIYEKIQLYFDMLKAVRYVDSWVVMHHL